MKKKNRKQNKSNDKSKNKKSKNNKSKNKKSKGKKSSKDRDQEARDESKYELNKQIQLENVFITNTVKGNAYLERYNMMAKQLNDKHIVESTDGCKKSKKYLFWEMLGYRRWAKSCLREAHFAKKDLKEQHNWTEKRIKKLMDSYFKDKIVKKEYNSRYDRNVLNAKFEPTDKTN